METNLTAIRALYTDCRNAKRDGLPVDHATVVSMVGTAAPEIVAAFDALLGANIAADYARMIEDTRRAAEKRAATLRAERATMLRAAERNARCDARRLAREAAATITEW